MNNLALLLLKQEKLDEAERLHRRALESQEVQLGNLALMFLVILICSDLLQSPF